jgi:hypothetical protein
LIAVVALGVLGGSAVAAPPACPAADTLSDLPDLQAFVIAAGGDANQELIDFFEHIDENDDGLICYKTLPEATPFPTPPLLAHDNRL